MLIVIKTKSNALHWMKVSLLKVVKHVIQHQSDVQGTNVKTGTKFLYKKGRHSSQINIIFICCNYNLQSAITLSQDLICKPTYLHQIKKNKKLVLSGKGKIILKNPKLSFPSLCTLRWLLQHERLLCSCRHIEGSASCVVEGIEGAG